MQKYIIIAVNKETKVRKYLKGESLASYEWTTEIEEANIYTCRYAAYYHWDQVIKLGVINPKTHRVLIPNYDENFPW